MLRRRVMLGVLALLLCGVFVRLGVWQLDRARQATALVGTLRSRALLPPLVIDTRLADDDRFLYRKALARGHYEPEHRVLLDDRKQNGWRGYHVIVPFRLAGSDIRLLVNRGWVSHDQPVRTALSGSSEIIRGLLVRPAVPFLRFGPGAKPGASWGTVWPYLDAHYFSQRNGYLVEPFVLVEDPQLARSIFEERLAEGDKQGMHIGYAIQWFFFALLALGLVVVSWRSDRGRKG